MGPKTAALSLVSMGRLAGVMDDIDDWCGTSPHHGFPPRPHGIRDALIAIAIHNLAAEVADPNVRDQIQALAANLYTAAGRSIAG